MDDKPHKVMAEGEGRTHFAPAARAAPAELARSIQIASRSPVLETLLRSVGGLLAVLNERRQVLAVNDPLLKVLGTNAAAELFGLRPGEALHCVHAHDLPGGCGTSAFCATCGAAVAMVASLTTDRPEERDCVMTVQGKRRPEELFFRVRSYPLWIDGQRLILLFLQDMTDHQRRATLERVFLHDISNLVAGLLGNAELLHDPGNADPAEMAGQLLQISRRLANEIHLQRIILHAAPSEVDLSLERVPASVVADEIGKIFAHHPVVKGRRLRIVPAASDPMLKTDRSLLIRVLANAVTNAFEATAEGDEVRFGYEPADGGAVFYVWNPQAIPDAVARRVFQRFFTTKQESGRGVGTYVMKLLTETYLGGKVAFTTAPGEGTTFRFSLPDRLSDDDRPPAS